MRVQRLGGGTPRRSLVAVLLLSAIALAPVAGQPEGVAAGPERAAPDAAPVRVLAVSVDALGSRAVRRLGPRRLPTLHRLLAEGAGTLEARAARELTLTLPNHTSMLTGRRISRRHGGHAVTWNDDRPRSTVRRAAGSPVHSVFDVVHRAGGATALFTGKEKFSLFPRSWPRAIDRFALRRDDTALVQAVRRDLRHRDRALTFLHLASPDVAGHARGFGSAAHRRAVVRADALLGAVLRTVESDSDHRTVVVLTADHGSDGANHHRPARAPNYRVPFLVWGPGVAAADLYALNPQRRDPGTGRPSYAARRQPVRNGDLANVVTALLGLRSVPGSEFGAAQDLRVR